MHLDSKQSKQKKRGCITMKLVAQMLVKAGLTHLITLDLHQKEIQGFFDIPVDNLRASPFLVDYIQEQVKRKQKISSKKISLYLDP
jgi:phosphoribosylpyrophosphate synthetase